MKSEKLTTRLMIFISPVILLFACNNKPEEKTTVNSEKKNDSAIIGAPIVNPYAAVDASPMDMSYFPVDYPKSKMTGSISTPPKARVIYSRPHKQGRIIFGGILKYGQSWRLGANEASEIEFFQPAIIAGNKIAAGRYLIYCIPQENKWTIVLNSNIYTWGLHIDSTKDLMKFDIPVKTLSTPVEYFTMVFQNAGSGAELVMAWDKVEARLPINF